MPQLHTFHMDLHPPTHVQLKISTVDVEGMLRLSVMQIFKAIGDHLHTRINQKRKKIEKKEKTYVQDMRPSKSRR